MRWLDKPLSTVTTFWRLMRRDGVLLGLTGHDRDLVFDGIVHRAAPGMLPSAVEMEGGLESDTMDVSGALTHDTISRADLMAGRWDGAGLVFGITDWMDPGAASHILARGELGAIEYSENGFQAELKSGKAVLDAPVAPQTSPTCRAALGDAHCKVSLHRYTHEAQVSSVDEAGIEFAGVTAAIAPDYLYGRLRWVSGANAGLGHGIEHVDGAALRLAGELSSAVQPGDRATLYQGCDKYMATCRARFDNMLNYQGEPYLPGNDLLTRYPGG